MVLSRGNPPGALCLVSKAPIRLASVTIDMEENELCDMFVICLFS